MKALRRYWLDAVALAVTLVVFVVPFVFVVLQAMKDRASSAQWRLSLPKTWHGIDNVRAVFKAADGLLLRAFRNSLVVTVASVALIVVTGAMVGFLLDRRRDRVARTVGAFVTMGLIIPPAIVPTIFVLQKLHVFGSLVGLILGETALGLPFAIVLFRAFASTIPREIDEAAAIDGCSGTKLFWKVIFPLLRPVIITVVLTSSIAIYNDFSNPLYFTPGQEHATVQLTLFNFRSQFLSQWNLLFMDSLLITVPPFVMFMFFNRKIVDGLAGAVKG